MLGELAGGVASQANCVCAPIAVSRHRHGSPARPVPLADDAWHCRVTDARSGSHGGMAAASSPFPAFGHGYSNGTDRGHEAFRIEGSMIRRSLIVAPLSVLVFSGLIAKSFGDGRKSDDPVRR